MSVKLQINEPEPEPEQVRFRVGEHEEQKGEALVGEVQCEWKRGSSVWFHPGTHFIFSPYKTISIWGKCHEYKKGTAVILKTISQPCACSSKI